MHVDSVNACTDHARHRRELITSQALRALGDPEREKRLAECMCLACFYLPVRRIACQAFTEWQCLQCHENQPAWPNSAHPRLCKSCADSYGICVECTADLELRPRRKLTRIKRASRPKAPPPIGTGEPQ